MSSQVPVRWALVCGGGGFIGSHLVRRLKLEGFSVQAVGLSAPTRDLAADEFLALDLTRSPDCAEALAGHSFTDVYQLAATTSGMESMGAFETEMLRTSVRINANMVEAATRAQVQRYFFA